MAQAEHAVKRAPDHADGYEALADVLVWGAGALRPRRARVSQDNV